MMRSSEHMAHVMYLADWKATRVSPPDPEQPLEWDDLSEEDQLAYLRRVNALFGYLFEHGRISSYLSHEMLDTLKAEYQAYLTEKETL